VLLLWRTGLRITEALSLGMRDLQLDSAAPTLRVRNGKFGKQRTVGIHQEAQVALERWLEVRSTLGLGRQRIVFCTISANNAGGPIRANYVRSMLTTKARKAGLSGRIHPHAFRATLAVELAREGVPLPAIRDVLGHANIAGTDAYLRRVFPQDAVAAVITRHQPEPDPAEQRVELLNALTSLDDAGVRRLLRALKD
jgi:integrase/recombinase XerC